MYIIPDYQIYNQNRPINYSVISCNYYEKNGVFKNIWWFDLNALFLIDAEERYKTKHKVRYCYIITGHVNSLCAAYRDNKYTNASFRSCLDTQGNSRRALLSKAGLLTWMTMRTFVESVSDYMLWMTVFFARRRTYQVCVIFNVKFIWDLCCHEKVVEWVLTLKEG